MDAPLAGRHAIVTGGGRGIGAAVSTSLAQSGARVTLMGRDRAALDAHARALQAFANVQAVAVDVTDATSVDVAFSDAARRYGPATILVNNAGQAASAPFANVDLALWDRMLRVNLTGTYLATQAVVPGMLDAGFGRVVNVASTAGLAGYPYVSAYCAAKHGVIGLTRALAMEFARRNITVNAVCPGYTDTDIVREAIANIGAKTGRTAEEALAELTRNNPQRRLVRPDEVASAVVWLCLPASDAVTGQAISVSGGEVM
jgi:NAD(P)-dependent dehydrogenase (short-subunit alcohol dehydrogenase family)